MPQSASRREDRIGLILSVARRLDILRRQDKPHNATVSGQGQIRLKLVHEIALKQVVLQNPKILNWEDCSAIESSERKVSGAWLFKGTRVPVKALFENLEGGATINEFVEWFPGVTRDQVAAVLGHAKRSLVDDRPGGGEG